MITIWAVQVDLYKQNENLQLFLIMKNNKADHYILNHCGNLELLKGSYTNFQFKPHFHESYTLIIIIGGVADYSYQKEKYVVPSGSFMVLNPGEIHTGKSIGHERWDFVSMYIPQDFMRDSIKHYGNNYLPYFDKKIYHDRTLAAQGLRFFENWIASKNDSIEHRVSFLQFLANVITKYSSSNYSPFQSLNDDLSVASSIKDYIHERYESNIKLNDISKLSGLSQFHALRIFKSLYGIPPRQYMINLRVEKAKELLQHHSSTDVALKTGFFDQAHFIRSFKSRVGISPKQFNN